MRQGKEATVKPALALVRTPPDDPPPARVHGSELALLGALFGLNIAPVVGELLRLGRWSPAIVGFAAAAALLTGRELWSQLRARRGEDQPGQGHAQERGPDRHPLHLKIEE
jgi:hypothetical protein